jgi:hypothetical protein
MLSNSGLRLKSSGRKSLTIWPLLTMVLLLLVYDEKLISDLYLRLGEETMGWQVEYHRMERVRVAKKIFGAPRW